MNVTIITDEPRRAVGPAPAALGDDAEHVATMVRPPDQRCAVW
ncbi:MAG TPA: hypothetical protein VHN14_25950 [Kofleriaceae bacterium]|nr:hypothetical protein [Kofleriaceae bacterium]